MEHSKKSGTKAPQIKAVKKTTQLGQSTSCLRYVKVTKLIYYCIPKQEGTNMGTTMDPIRHHKYKHHYKPWIQK